MLHVLRYFSSAKLRPVEALLHDFIRFGMAFLGRENTHSQGQKVSARTVSIEERLS